MNFKRDVSMCPYLTGKPKGMMCNAVQVLIKNIDGIDLNVCACRRFESCHIYLSQLEEIYLATVSETTNSSLLESKRN
jgi:hypothetical protein